MRWYNTGKGVWILLAFASLTGLHIFKRKEDRAEQEQEQEQKD